MILQMTEVTRSYPSPSGRTPLTVLQGVCLSLDRGESLAITGPSGSGKSTLLHLAAALDLPDGGTVAIEDRQTAGLDDDELALLRNRKVGMVFQNHFLLPQFTLLENVLVPTLPNAKSGDRDSLYQRALYLLERMGLSGRLDHTPSELSGGECQRVALARALVNSPALLCADEPTGCLDGVTAAEIGNLLGEINREEGVALLVVTHSEKLAAEMDRRLELVDRSLRVPGHP